MKKAILMTISAAIGMLLTGCASTNGVQQKGDSHVYHLTGVPTPYTAGVPESAKYKAYVASYAVNEEHHGKQEFRTVNYAEFIKAALTKRFGTSIAFIDNPKGADIEILMKHKTSGYNLKFSDFQFITAQVNGILVTAKGQVYHSKPHWPPTDKDLATEIEASSDALVSVLKETPKGSIEVAPLRVFVDADIFYYKEKNGLSVMEGPLGYNVENRIVVE